MKAILCALALAGCSRPPDPPLYFVSETIERDGVTVTRTFSGPTLPPRLDFDPIATNEP